MRHFLSSSWRPGWERPTRLGTSQEEGLGCCQVQSECLLNTFPPIRSKHRLWSLAGWSLAGFTSHLHHLLGVWANHLSFPSILMYQMGIIGVPTLLAFVRIK